MVVRTPVRSAFFGRVRRIQVIPGTQLAVEFTHDGLVRVYERSKGGEPIVYKYIDLTKKQMAAVVRMVRK